MRNTNIHVMHAVLSLETGGLERVVLSLVREGLRLGQRITLLCVERPGKLAPEVERLGVEIYCLNKSPGLRPGVIGPGRRLLRSVRPDVVHSHQMGALLYIGHAARREGIPVVVHTEHGKHYDNAGLRARLLGRIASLRAQQFCCVSQDIGNAIVGKRIAPAAKVVVVPNGIDTAKFGATDGAEIRAKFGIPAAAPVVGTVGNLREVKRQDVLLRGFAKVTQWAGEPPHLLLVGDGVLRGELERLAGELGIADRTHFAGHQANPEQFLDVMDVFALTSRSEGMPLAVLEAWAAGLPVVVSRVGGLPELVEEHRTGLMFESGDADALAGHFQALLSDPDGAARMGRAGRDMVRARFDVSVMAGNYQQRYTELLARVDGSRAVTDQVKLGRVAQ
jgi:glycosyltransferase involved in cell wall biosynthesis